MGEPKKIPVERRAHARVGCLETVAFKVSGRVYKGVIANMSVSGIFINTPEKFSIGEKIFFAYDSRMSNERLKFSGVIVRVDTNGIGIEIEKCLAVT